MQANIDESHIERLRIMGTELKAALEQEISRLGELAKRSRNLHVSRLDFYLRKPAQYRDRPAGLHPTLDELTPREVQVLKCIAEGNSTKQVATALGVTFKTAACHRHRIMQKLNVHETTSLVRLAIRCGLVNL